MGVLPEKGINGTLWNVMGPVRNGDGKGNGRSGTCSEWRRKGERKKWERIRGKNRKVRRRLVTVGGSGEGRGGIVPDLVHPLNELCGRFVRCVGGDDFWGVWVVAVHEVEWGESSRNMDSVVVGKFGHGYPLRPVVLVVVEEDPEVLLQLLIDALRLSICLWVKGHQGVVLDPEGSVERSHEL